MLALLMVHPDDKKPRVAPAPPPSAEARERAAKTKGFGSGARVRRFELLLILAAPVLLGLGIAWGGGAVAALLTPLVPLEVDQFLGQASQRQLELTSPECSHPSALAYVRRVVAPLLAVTEEQPFEYQFRVAADPSINAYALPGGFVTVNWGLLEAAEGPEEVAGVLAHELSHVMLRHGVRRVLRQAGAGVALALLVGGTDAALMTRLSQDLLSLSYDRDQEAQADEEGLHLLTRAHIDPQGLATFFDRLSHSGAAVPELISTHPDPGQRAAKVAEARERMHFKPGESAFQDLPPLSQVRCM